MEIDRRMEQYFREGLAQGCSTHICKVGLTADNKISLRMSPVRMPTAQDMAQLPTQVKQWARAQAQNDVDQIIQSTPNPVENPFAAIEQVRRRIPPAYDDLDSVLNRPIITRKGATRPEPETVETYKSPLAGME